MRSYQIIPGAGYASVSDPSGVPHMVTEYLYSRVDGGFEVRPIRGYLTADPVTTVATEGDLMEWMKGVHGA